MPLVVGFDLDMTLVDPRPGVVATYAALSAETGVFIDGELAASRLGPPLEQELAEWFGADADLVALGDAYRRHFATLGVEGTTALPHTEAALSEIHAMGGRVVVVTSKAAHLASATLARLGLGDLVDAVHGRLFADEKGIALTAERADVYVGDHLGDVVAARSCGAASVAVATGPISATDLAAAGADVVLTSLEGLAEWLDLHRIGGVDGRKISQLQQNLTTLGSMLVAFSGGADSALVLAAAVKALGADNVVAATAVSDSLPASELADARQFAAGLGVRHLTPATNELDREGYRSNGSDRCAFCKSELLDVLNPIAAELELAAVVTGTNADDVVAGFRPGIAAASERRAVTPLASAGLTKPEVRRLSRAWGLTTWDKPQAACLSSRIAYGIEVSRDRLQRVERAESALRQALIDARIHCRDLRVRDLGETARIEVDRELVAVLNDRPELVAAVTGWETVAIDPLGFRSGSMNRAVAGKSGAVEVRGS